MARTPRTAWAREVSMPRMRAWACGLRTNAAYVVPGTVMSSVKRPRPVRKRASSRRRTLSPSTEPGLVGAVIGNASLLDHGSADRRVDRLTAHRLRHRDRHLFGGCLH